MMVFSIIDESRVIGHRLYRIDNVVRIPCCTVIDILMIYNSEPRKSKLNLSILICTPYFKNVKQETRSFINYIS